MARFNALAQYFDSSGAPLISGFLYFFDSGTTTPKVTYADVNLTIPNTHPVELTAAGRQPNIFFDGAAKVVLTDAQGITPPGTILVTQDPVGQTDLDLQLRPWSSTFRYQLGALVAYDGLYYLSLINNNLANQPDSSPTAWELWPFPSVDEGVVFAGTGTGIIAVGPGANGQTLIADSAEPGGVKWDSTASPASVLVAGPMTPTASANVDFLTAFTSAYDEYLIIGDGLVPASDAGLRVQFANAGVVDTGANYATRGGASSVSGASSSLSGSTEGTVTTDVESSSALGCNFWMRISNANAASSLKSASAKSEYADASAGGSSYMAGIFYSGAALTGFRLFWSTGNFTATGSIKVIGIRNS